ncbi:GIY-YIG nuclease family protein [Flavobacterium macacae]|uniref:GIY-YIG nuclease family protein n=1 Tax=Flavobacterium macacae TaxID=2488993 RepID=A0A3P3W719_9FLAO|nr:GIY-YIG nuclease family protein [Flavobacterium macacae]RRJ90750.1 GIY-YIG nuclease family protein [Flavobacterium macacae]
MNFEKHLIEAIQKERVLQNDFANLVDKFEDKISNFDFERNSILIDDYFSFGNGQRNILKKLIAENKVTEANCRKYETKDKNIKYDFKGIYFFLLDSKPFYVGISKGVIGRICQHLKGKNHNTSSLAYKLGLLRYEYLNGEKYSGSRKELNFVSEVEPVKDFLKKQRIAWINIENDEELYLFEIFCSMKFKTILNSFETH